MWFSVFIDSSTNHVRRLRQKRKAEDFKENNDLTKDVIEMQKDIKSLLENVNNKLDENNKFQNDTLQELKVLNSNVQLLNNNITILASFVSSAVGVELQNCS